MWERAWGHQSSPQHLDQILCLVSPVFNKSILAEYRSLTDTPEAINCPSGISIWLLPRSILFIPMIAKEMQSSPCVPLSPLYLQ